MDELGWRVVDYRNRIIEPNSAAKIDPKNADEADDGTLGNNNDDEESLADQQDNLS